EGYSFQVERLDDISLNEEKIDFCKIDVDGFELKALDGMKKTLEKYKPVVLIESIEHDSKESAEHYSDYESNAPLVREFFKELGCYNEAICCEDYNWLFLPK
ncbi:methyltransferase FkbM, partial [Candidatus Gastranaerophilus sp. (ex Termes propinquus)]